ncbi:MAG: 3-oxoacyl-ACP reductase [Acidimicrobiaceae bacterium]|nr:3-oxoacyl-ACP reductase [Acidimicrobiaceae bacterium]HAQ22544.1 3-oxoacyl-ACP reductase [Acidimicrobiaceae bacterium]|tara:strand:- start:80 stop:841 length:762 start_codon:yes stop_codon:yes gene_type:complete
MDIRLDGKVAIVTGGSRGIGRGIAGAMAEAGAKVMVTSRNEESCATTVAELQSSTGGDLTYVAGHIGKTEDMERVLDATMEAFGAIDILVNNAATNPYAGPVIEIDVPRWEKTFSTNLTAPLVWTQACWNRWMKEHGGAVVNVSSVGAFGTNAILGVYDITKRALVHLTEQLAAEVGPAVRVNAVCPGLVRTDFARALWEDGRGDAIAEMLPLKRLGEPEDIAQTVVFMASDAASWMTGHAVLVDGGQLVNLN